MAKVRKSPYPEHTASSSAIVEEIVQSRVRALLLSPKMWSVIGLRQSALQVRTTLLVVFEDVVVVVVVLFVVVVFCVCCSRPLTSD